MTIRHRSLGAAMRAGLALFGAWSLYAQVAAFLGADFATLKTLSFLPMLVAAAFLLITVRERSGRPSSADACGREIATGPWIQCPDWLWLAVPALLAGLYWATRSEWLFWSTSTAYLLAASRAAAPDGAAPTRDTRVAVWELTVLLGLCGVALLLGLGANRPNADDGYFVSVAASAIDNPGAPLFGFDNVCRSGMPLLQQYLHFGQVYEYLVAALADLGHVPVRVIYYVVLPALWLPLGILAHWYLLRRWLPAAAALVGLTAVITLLAVWGDGVCTYGNFAFVRIFQGKSIFMFVAVPLLVQTALEYLDRPSWSNWALLVLHQCAAVGLTTTAQVVAPLSCALVLLSGLRLPRTRWRVVVSGLCASSPAVLTGVATMSLVRPFRGFGENTDLLLGYPIVLGSSRTSLVLLGLLLLPALSRMAGLPEARWLGRYVLLASALLLCPAIPGLISAHIARVLGWRVFWAWPVPLLLGLSFGAASCRLLAHPWLRRCVLGAALTAFALAGPSAVSRYNWAWANVGAFKVPGDYGVAERLMSLAPRGGLGLVPEGLAVSLCGFQNAPPLVAVRRQYLDELHGVIPEQDRRARLDLLAYIGGAADRRPLDWVVGEIDRRGVTTVAFRKTHPDADLLLSRLKARGFQMTHHGGYWLAARSASGE